MGVFFRFFQINNFDLGSFLFIQVYFCFCYLGVQNGLRFEVFMFLERVVIFFGKGVYVDVFQDRDSDWG